MHCHNSCILLALGCTGLIAQTMTLEQALTASVQRNPLLLAGQDRVAAAEGFKLQAGLKPNPRLVVQHENFRAWEFSPGLTYWRDTDTTIYGSFLIERGAKRERRVDHAAAGVERAAGEGRQIAFDIKSRVAAAYWNAVASARIVDLYREDVRNFEQIVAYNRQRVDEGASAGADLLRIEVERDRLIAGARGAEHDAEQARVELFREMGAVDFPDVTLTSPIELVPDAPVAAIEDVFAARPDLQAAGSAVRQSERNIALQKAEGKVDPEVQVGYERNYGYDGLYAAVSIPLPLRNRNQGNVAAAEAESRSVRNELEALRNRARAEVEAAVRDYNSRKRTLVETIAPLRSRTRMAAELALGAYREGGVDLLRFLDAERVRIETEVLYYRSLADLQQSVVALKRAEGKEQ
jgi:cobalt-zinc-cadmium efflux system outer membrane protein